MFGRPLEGANRFFCGRTHPRPLLIRLTDALGWHQELYYLKGERVLRVRWVKHREPGRSVYTCRKPMNHWRFTLKPEGQRWVNFVHDYDFSKPDLEAAAHIKNKRTPYWRGRILQPSRKFERIQIPTRSWEIGHKYLFTRFEEG